MSLMHRRFRVIVKRYGHYQFELPVTSRAHAREVLKRYPHGVVITREGAVVEELGFQ